MAVLGFIKKQRKLKKTRQGAGRGTKWGSKVLKNIMSKDIEVRVDQKGVRHDR